MKMMKKALSLLLCVVMAMALCITAFATEPSTTPSETTGKTVTLTISNPVADHTYNVYQILTGDVSGLSNGSGTLSNVKVGSSVKAEYKDAAAIVDALKGLSEGALGNAAYAYVDTKKNPVATLNTTTTSATVVEGYYVIVDASYSGTATTNVVYSRNVVAVVGDTTIEPKTETPSIDKNIIDTDANKALEATGANPKGKTDTAAIGDTINFEITGTVPNYEGYTYYYYVLNDTLSEGLTLVDDNNDKFTVTITETKNAVTTTKTLNRGTDYNVYKGTDAAPYSFILAFTNIKDYVVGSPISVKYNATINENAKIGTEANTNTVKLQYSNKPNESSQKDKEGKPGVPDTTVPTGETPNYITKTYVTELNLTKVDQDKMPLKGAEFTLSGTNLNKVIIRTDYTFTEDAEKGTYYKLIKDKDGKDLTTAQYTTTAPVETTYEADGTTVKVQGNSGMYEKENDAYTKYTRTTNVSTTTTSAAESKVVATVNDNGFVTITGLNKGDYTLTETKTPEGYNTINPISFTISASLPNPSDSSATEGGSIVWASSNANVKLNGGTFYVTIENSKGNVLPSTGGIGTTIFYVIGGLLVAGAAVVLITRRRMAK